MKYNFSKLWSTQFFGFYRFKSFLQYASDKECQAEYYNNLITFQFDMDENSKSAKKQDVIEEILKENETSLEMIKNHHIVFLFTRYESIIQETMNCLTCDAPERIIKFLKIYPDYKEFIGFSLSEFLECESKEEYVTVISERLSSKILSGKPSGVLKRLKCLLDVQDIQTDLLDELMVKRNRIVHEGQIYKLDLDELEMYYETIETLLKNLALALKKINISVVDDGDLLIQECRET